MASKLCFITLALLLSTSGCGVTDTDDDGTPGGGGSEFVEGTQLADVENELLVHINAERTKAGLPELVRDPGLDEIMRWWGTQMYTDHELGHVDANDRDAEARARYYSGSTNARASEIVQWWGGIPASGQVHYEGYFNSPPHHAAYMEEGVFDLGPTTHTGIFVFTGKGPAGTEFEDREGTYSGLIFCDQPLTLKIDPFSD